MVSERLTRVRKNHTHLSKTQKKGLIETQILIQITTVIYSADQLSLESLFCCYTILSSTWFFWGIHWNSRNPKWRTVDLYTITRITRIVILQFKVFSTLLDAMILCNQAVKYVIVKRFIIDFPDVYLTWNVIKLSWERMFAILHHLWPPPMLTCVIELLILVFMEIFFENSSTADCRSV